jgi:hypothetical protein
MPQGVWTGRPRQSGLKFEGLTRPFPVQSFPWKVFTKPLSGRRKNSVTRWPGSIRNCRKVSPLSCAHFQRETPQTPPPARAKESHVTCITSTCHALCALSTKEF